MKNIIKISCIVTNWRGYGNLGYGDPDPETADIKTKLIVIRADNSKGDSVICSTPKEFLLKRLPSIIERIDEFVNHK